MCMIVALLVVVLIAVPFLTALVVLDRRSWALSVTYAACVLVAVVAAFFSTFSCEYYANSNTRMLGWPLPRVIFQREGPGEPWLDFVGWTAIGAFPVNAAMFLFIPAVIILIIAKRGGRRTEDRPNE